MAGSIDMAADIWQTFRQPDFRTQSLQRRQFWIDQANVRQGNMPKVAVVTGANAGLGFETAKSLVETGYLVILACRSVTKGQEAVEQIETQTGIRNMAVTMPLDLSSFKSIQAFALDFKNRGIGLDVLVNSKCLMRSPQEGAITLLYLALAPELDDVSGEYFFDQIPRKLSPIALDEKAQEELWAMSIQFTGVDVM
ncbi:hypothetical protein BG003_008446 [Podila horticola]|nr:hypothetical protein BG003_008446 [Podila horticola]